jgi:hypothetical protein
MEERAAREPGEERRRSARLQLRRLVRMRWRGEDSPREADCFSFSISRFGCGLYAPQALAPGTPLEFEFEGRRISGRVLYAIRVASQEEVELGVSFEEDGAAFWAMEF